MALLVPWDFVWLSSAEAQHFISPVFCLNKEEIAQNQKIWTQPFEGGWVGHAPNRNEGHPGRGSFDSSPIPDLIPA